MRELVVFCDENKRGLGKWGKANCIKRTRGFWDFLKETVKSYWSNKRIGCDPKINLGREKSTQKRAGRMRLRRFKFIFVVSRRSRVRRENRIYRARCGCDPNKQEILETINEELKFHHSRVKGSRKSCLHEWTEGGKMKKLSMGRAGLAFSIGADGARPRWLGLPWNRKTRNQQTRRRKRR